MFGKTELYTALNVSAITDLLDLYDSNPALWGDALIPEKFILSKSVNFYMISTADGSLEYGEYRYTINCRANDQVDSLEIAHMVYTTLNREQSSDGNTMFYCSVLPIIPPLDESDNYNTPVEVEIKIRN